MIATRAAITPRQNQLLGAIKFWFVAHGYSPTVRELGSLVGLESASTVKHHLDCLQQKGYIRWLPGHMRTITVIEEPE